jgi:hypothetical protein
MRQVMVLPLIVCLVVVGLLDDSSRLSGSAQSAAPAGEEFVGTWLATVPLPSGSIVQVAAFDVDGTVVSVGPPVRAITPGDPSSLVFNSDAVGSWVSTGPKTSTITYVRLNADAQGNYLGTTTIRSNQLLSEDGESFTAQADIITRDPAGKVMATRTVEVEGVRLQPEPPELGTPTT